VRLTGALQCVRRIWSTSDLHDDVTFSSRWVTVIAASVQLKRYKLREAGVASGNPLRITVSSLG